MQHNKRYVIVLTAWVLVLVTVLATPASAAGDSYLSGFYMGSTSSGSKVVKEYFCPYSDSSTYAIKSSTISSLMANIIDKGFYDSSSDFSVVTDSTNTYYQFEFTPILDAYYSGNPTGADEFFLNDVCSADASSFLIKAGAVLYSDVTVSGVIYIDGRHYTDIDRGFRSSAVSFTVNAGSYIDIYSEFDLKDTGFSLDEISKFKLKVCVRFDRVPAGSYLEVKPSTIPSATDDLSPGVLFLVEDVKAQEAPVFTKNLDTPDITYLVGYTPNPLSVTAKVTDGGIISYQWYKSGSSATSAGTPISGATSNLFYPDTSAESEAYYYCVATSTLNGATKSTVSKIVHVSVCKLPVKPQIVNDLNDGAVIEYYQGATAGNLLFGCVVTDGGTLSYQWFEKSSPSAAGTKISGATASTYRPPTDTIGIKYYYCVASNKKGLYSESVTSGLVGVRIISPPDPARAPVINSDLPTEPFTYTEGDAASPLRIGASSPDGGVLSYQWYEIINGSGKSIAGEIYATFTPDTVAPGTHQYFCIITNSLEDTFATAASSVATVVIEEDNTDSLLGTITDGISDLIDGILSLPQKFLDGIKGLFVPDSETMAGYQDRWFSLLASRFGAIYQAVTLIDEFGQAISDQAARGVVDFPQVTINLAGTPFVFGGWQVDVVPDGFGVIFDALKLMIDIVATLAFVNGLRHRFEGILGGE